MSASAEMDLDSDAYIVDCARLYRDHRNVVVE